eukprot:COSAG03_NODE_13998_length_480_cov_1.771654_2_plen_62_part_01
MKKKEIEPLQNPVPLNPAHDPITDQLVPITQFTFVPLVWQTMIRGVMLRPLRCLFLGLASLP